MDPRLYDAVTKGNADLLLELLTKAEEAHLVKKEQAENAAKVLNAEKDAANAAAKAAKDAKKAAKDAKKAEATGEENASDQEAMEDLSAVEKATKLAAAKAKKEAEKATKEVEKAQKDWEKYQNQTDENRNTLLHVAAKYDNVKVVEIINEKLPKTLIRANNNQEGTPLHIAALSNNAQVVKYLLDWAEALDEEANRGGRNRTAEIRNGSGNTAFHEAVLERKWKVIEQFTKWNAGVVFWKDNRNRSPIHLAAERGWKDMLDKLLIDGTLEIQSSKKNPYKGPDGRTPLHAAIAAKSIECIKTLLDKMEELIDTPDDTGSNPLHYVASLGYSGVASCMMKIKDSSTAHQKNSNGLYPIHIAASEGHACIIKDMAKHWQEAIDSLTDKEKQNVVHLAAKNGRSNLVKYMLNHNNHDQFGKLLNAKDIDANTPLHLATINAHPEVVNILIADRKIDRTILNHDGLTAQDIAERRQMADTVSLSQLLTLTTYRINTASSDRLSSSIEENISTKSIRDYMENRIKRFKNLDIVAALIITVTFAAGFTVPGGFTSDGSYRGMAILLRKPAFNIFVICDSMAFYLSIIVVVNNISARLANNIYLITIASKISLILLGVALIMMAIAFSAGLYSVILKLDWLAITILVMGGIFLLYIVFLLVLFRFRKVMWVSHHLNRSIQRLFMLTFD